jgi:hypothetical protein
MIKGDAVWQYKDSIKDGEIQRDPNTGLPLRVPVRIDTLYDIRSLDRTFPAMQGRT